MLLVVATRDSAGDPNPPLLDGRLRATVDGARACVVSATSTVASISAVKQRLIESDRRTTLCTYARHSRVFMRRRRRKAVIMNAIRRRYKSDDERLKCCSELTEDFMSTARLSDPAKASEVLRTYGETETRILLLLLL